MEELEHKIRLAIVYSICYNVLVTNIDYPLQVNKDYIYEYYLY